MTISSHKCTSLLKLQWIICEEHSNYIRNDASLSFDLCTCVLNISRYNNQTVHIPTTVSWHRPGWKEQHIEHLWHSSSSSSSWGVWAAPPVCGCSDRSFCSSGKLHSYTKHNDKAHVRNNLSSRTALHIHDSLNTCG